jgi:rhodanese-related sulfurtransferase
MFGLFERTKSYQDLTAVEFNNKITDDRNAAILDVRTDGEFRMGHIKGAINIDMLRSDFASRLAKLDKNKTYYVYCRSGNRSGKACTLLKLRGYAAYNLAGGISNWDGNIVT